jgi:hypothetical protein
MVHLWQGAVGAANPFCVILCLRQTRHQSAQRLSHRINDVSLLIIHFVPAPTLALWRSTVWGLKTRWWLAGCVLVQDRVSETAHVVSFNPPPTGSDFSFQLLVIISDDPTSRPLEQRTKITTTTYGASNAQSVKSTNPTLKRNNSPAHAPNNPKLSSPFEQNLAGL